MSSLNNNCRIQKIVFDTHIARGLLISYDKRASSIHLVLSLCRRATSHMTPPARPTGYWAIGKTHSHVGSTTLLYITRHILLLISSQLLCLLISKIR